MTIVLQASKARFCESEFRKIYRYYDDCDQIMWNSVGLPGFARADPIQQNHTRVMISSYRVQSGCISRELQAMG